MPTTAFQPPIVAQRITLTGRVQGMGLRPAVAACAHSLAIAGNVRNTSQGVEIEVEGPAAAVAEFTRQLRHSLPGAAQLDRVQTEPISPTGRDEFAIDNSTTHGPLLAAIPTDLAVCDNCLSEVDNLNNRRVNYPFTGCTACGPRYSIISSMPYDRTRTSMHPFSQCDVCLAEYAESHDRRFHAQTNACSACGPRLWAHDADGNTLAHGTAAIDLAIAALRQRQIVALRGVGGYQLLVDATCDEAVAQLRNQKGRPAKPLAILVATLDAAKQIAVLSPAECAALTDPTNPIVVATQQKNSGLSPSISGELNSVGVMLPTAPLHFLLAKRFGPPLVATSGNVEGEPLAYQIELSATALKSLAQVWLQHDREIVRPIDDAVVRVIANCTVSLRLGRGMAPLPLELPTSLPGLATGGDQKSAIALTNGRHAALGPHVGDLQTVAARQRWTEHVQAFISLYGEKPRWIAHDLHPDFFSTRWAAAQKMPTIPVQHHHAHAVAAMLQHNWLDRPTLAVVWDGTGYGTDGTIWGGEGLYATATNFQRMAHCRPFSLPGGEAAIHQPWRTAASVLLNVVDVESIIHVLGSHIEPQQISQVAKLATHEKFAPRTTSMGRLFDAVAVLILGIHHSQFNGQSAMLLEAACDPLASGSYQLALTDDFPQQWDWRGLFVQLLSDRTQQVPPSVMAMRFHRALAAAIDALAHLHPTLPVVLAGGVFQNRVLVELVADHAATWAQPLGLPGVIPPGDGGLAAGQLAVAIARQQIARFESTD
jgi:hydrogenase maturation protein HypF